MNKLQYDSFYKFIVSIGIILIGAPIVGMHFFFNGNYDVIISEKEYSELSSISLQLLEEKEKLISHIFPQLPAILLTSIVIGILCIIWGGLKWYKIQKTLDENIELDVKWKRFQFQKLSPEEIAEKAISENNEYQEESGDYNVSEQYQGVLKGI